MGSRYDELRRRFLCYQEDEDSATVEMNIRSHGFNFAVFLTQTVPAGDALDIALERLEEVVMWAETAIVRDGTGDEKF